tara:strand:- start:36718 stop:36918 length:201 start_codon:yes stop_codon:yes gene_type:complete
VKARTLDFQGMEIVYELLANTIDEVGKDKEALFLSKLCLMLAHEIPDISKIEAAVAVARQIEQGTM